MNKAEICQEAIFILKEFFLKFSSQVSNQSVSGLQTLFHTDTGLFQ